MTDEASSVTRGEDSRLIQARELVRLMEQGEGRAADRLLGELSQHHNDNLFRQLGQLTRDLHEAINSFQLDSRLADLADKEIPDAKQRLNYVVSMTEEAAHKTLNAVEGSLPVVESLSATAGELKQAWTRFRTRKMSADEFRSLAQEIDEFLERASSDAAAIRGDLSAVMMAQGAQDLAGQIIRRAVNLIQDLEDNLVELIRITGLRFREGYEHHSPSETRGGGPVVPSVDRDDVVTSQDEVDDLLSSLGF